MDMREYAETYFHQLEKHRLEQKRRQVLIDRYEDYIKVHREKMHKSDYPKWIDCMVKPIACVLVKHYPGYKASIMGPFGIAAETSIWLLKEGYTTNSRNEPDKLNAFDHHEGLLSIDFRPDLDLDGGRLGLTIVNRKVNTGMYRENTIGEVNGLNHPDLPMIWDEDEFVAFFAERNKRE